MCGIAGVLNIRGEPERQDHAALMAQSLSHRGPDGWRAHADGPVALAHARLRIIDLSERANQPLFNEDKTVAIVLNGEIYNYEQLRSELIEKGARFQTTSDTEVALKLYEQEGTDCFRRLDGMFALAIWDGRSRSLVLARDRAGKKPLFLYRDQKRFAFASEVKALSSHPLISTQPNFSVLPYYLTYGYVPAPYSFYQRVQMLLPGSYVVLSGDGTSSENAFWEPTYRPNGHLPPPEAEESLRRRLSEAVEKRLVADVPVGAFLSGGLDSTVVVGLMARLARFQVKTFSVGFEGEPQYDETEYALMAARSFGTEHTEIRLPPPSPDLIEKLTHFHDGPFGDSSAIPCYLVSQLARREVTVVLNGDGGDELFAGYLRFWAATSSERIPGWVSRAGAAGAKFLPEPLSHKHPLKRLKRWATALALPLPERYLAWVGYFGSEIPGIFRDPDALVDRASVLDHLAAPLAEAKDASPLSRVLFMNYKTYLPGDLLVKMDRCSMAHGLEARSPLLDTSLVEFAAGLHDNLKLSRFKSKVLLRSAFRDLIPPPILNRPKMGFGVPLGPWLRGPLKNYLMDHIGSPKSRIFEHLKPERVEPYLRAHMSGERDFGHQLFCLLTLENWLRGL